MNTERSEDGITRNTEIGEPDFVIPEISEEIEIKDEFVEENKD